MVLKEHDEKLIVKKNFN